MNERILDIVVEADKDYALATVPAETLEKFAELIVQECLMKAQGAKIRGESLDELIERIKEDFGVDE